MRVNGTEQAMPDPPTVAGLLKALGAPPDGVAVAVNRAVVPRSRHASHHLEDDDEVEVIQAGGGG